MRSIEDLTVFHEVVRSGSFVGAATVLGITASGVSRRISRFEERLGVRLFNRTTRALSLTEIGEILSERCESILSSVEALEDVIQDISAGPRGTLRIAASDALSSEVIVPFLTEFSKSYPDLSVTLVHGDGRIDLLDERIDLALMFEQPTATSFIAKKLLPDPWIVCAAPSYISEHGTPKTPGDLHAHRCLTIHARGVTRDNWRFTENNAETTVQVKSAFSGIGLTVKTAALQGQGIARLAHFLVCPAIEQGQLVPLLLEYTPPSDRHIFAVYPNRQYLPAKVRVFVDAFSVYIRQKLIIPDVLKSR